MNIMPYIELKDGWSIPMDVMGQIYLRMVEENKADTLFYSNDMKDPYDFVAFMQDKNNWPVVIFNDEMDVGMVAWLNQMNDGNAQAHFCTFKGHNPLKMGKALLEWWGDYKDDNGVRCFKTIVGITPETYYMALKYIGKLGFTQIGTLPNFCYLEKKGIRVGGVVSYYIPGGNSHG